MDFLNVSLLISLVVFDSEPELDYAVKVKLRIILRLSPLEAEIMKTGAGGNAVRLVMSAWPEH